jgi:hypothetical protein
MRIDQRNNGASVTPTSGGYTLDRWALALSSGSKLSIQQLPSDSITTSPPTGFINYLGSTSLSAYSLAAGDFFGIMQNVEGLNVADFGWGTAAAQSVTLSFWVRSSLTGTFSVSFRNSASNRSYVAAYTVSAANTWEQKVITVPGDTSGTWLITNGLGIQLWFNLGAGSTFSTTANTWTAGNFVGSTGATSVVSTNGATFYITGVQLEAGSVATPFERRPFGTELALCQRYYYKLTSSGNGPFGNGFNNATTTARSNISFPVSMRTTPTALEQSGTAADYRILHGTTATTCSAVPTHITGINELAANVTFTVSSGLTTGQGSQVAALTSSAYLGWSAELWFTKCFLAKKANHKSTLA